MSETTVAHGTISRYCHQKCRCDLCREAWSVYFAAYRAANREKLLAYDAAYYRANKERHYALSRRWKAANREKVRASGRAYMKARWEADPEGMRLYTQAWRRALPEEKRLRRAAYSAAYRAQHLREHTASQQRRDAIKARAAGARYTTSAHIAARWEMWGNACRYCGAAATATDHRIPLSRGGAHWPSNLVPACKTCNSRKHTKTELEFLADERRVAA